MMSHAKMLCKISLHKFPFCLFLHSRSWAGSGFEYSFRSLMGSIIHTKGSKAPIFPATFQVRRGLWRNGRPMLPLRLARCVGRVKLCKLSFSFGQDGAMVLCVWWDSISLKKFGLFNTAWRSECFHDFFLWRDKRHKGHVMQKRL